MNEVELHADGLRVRYPGADRPALDGVSLTVGAGELFAVLGPNGSGKSTLLRALLGVVRPDRGEVRVGGRPRSAWGRREFARTVGVVAQSEHVAFPLTVREMVEMGRYPHLGALAPQGADDRAAVDRALERCDVAHLHRRDVTTLSGGELQRVRVARALAQEPGALVLDEPTANLDIRHEMTILELLRAWADRGLTVLLVTHGLELAGRFADRLLLLSEGRVAAHGSPDEVLREETLARVYGWPITVEPDAPRGGPRITPERRTASRRDVDATPDAPAP